VEAREVTWMARRIAALLLLEEKLNNHYKQAKENRFGWK
jgi:hypothetical protein